MTYISPYIYRSPSLVTHCLHLHSHSHFLRQTTISSSSDGNRILSSSVRLNLHSSTSPSSELVVMQVIAGQKFNPLLPAEAGTVCSEFDHSLYFFSTLNSMGEDGSQSKGWRKHGVDFISPLHLV